MKLRSTFARSIATAQRWYAHDSGLGQRTDFGRYAMQRSKRFRASAVMAALSRLAQRYRGEHADDTSGRRRPIVAGTWQHHHGEIHTTLGSLRSIAATGSKITCVRCCCISGRERMLKVKANGCPHEICAGPRRRSSMRIFIRWLRRRCQCARYRCRPTGLRSTLIPGAPSS